VVFTFLLLLVLWPLVEIAVFIQVVHWIGVLDALALMLVVSLAGAWIVKRQGMGTVARMRTELDAGRVPASAMLDGALLLLAGMLLLLPGFVGDAFGLLLLLPPVRAVVKLWLVRRFTVRAQRGPRTSPRGPSPERHQRWDPPEIDV